MKYEPFKEKYCKTANELWELLSPTNNLFDEPCKLIYRGQSDSNWGLIPSVLRKNKNNQLIKLFKQESTADIQIYNELCILNKFVEYCDNLGIKIPNDSISFRERNLNTNNIDKYLINPVLWPNEEIFELMAMAQHHSVPTRLLDWTETPYVAMYFAVSSAFYRYIELLEKKEIKGDEKIAIWVLNLEVKNLYDFKTLYVPRSSTLNISSQKGLFTVHPHNGNRGESFVVEGLENVFSILPNTPLLKITLPLNEVINLYNLCEKVGMTSTSLFPNTQGVEKGIKDTLNKWYLTDNLLK